MSILLITITLNNFSCLLKSGKNFNCDITYKVQDDAGGVGQALGAAGQGVTAAMTPQQLYNQYASVIFGTPSASYNPDFRGTQGSTQSSDYTKFSFNPFNLKG